MPVFLGGLINLSLSRRVDGARREGGQVAGQGAAAHAALPRYGAHGLALGQAAGYEGAVGMELVFVRGAAAAARPAQCDPLGLAPRQSLARALTDEVALNLGREGEGESQHLALDVVAQAVVVLDGPHAALARHAQVQNLHYHKQVAPKARQFGANDEVAAPHPVEQFAQFTL